MMNRSDQSLLNLLFEGVAVLPDVETEAYILQLCSVLGTIPFPNDIETVAAMKQRDQS